MTPELWLGPRGSAYISRNGQFFKRTAAGLLVAGTIASVAAPNAEAKKDPPHYWKPQAREVA